MPKDEVPVAHAASPDPRVNGVYWGFESADGGEVDEAVRSAARECTNDIRDLLQKPGKESEEG